MKASNPGWPMHVIDTGNAYGLGNHNSLEAGDVNHDGYAEPNKGSCHLFLALARSCAGVAGLRHASTMK